jgi:hypothetical protein
MAAIKDAVDNHDGDHDKQGDHHIRLELVRIILVSQGGFLARHLGKKQYDIEAKDERYERCPYIVILARLLLLYLWKKPLEEAIVPQYSH